MPADTRPSAIVLLGPTASGKSALALDWAERLGGEIVSIDSALVYRGLDIGAAKPTLEERARVPHHLVDMRDPWEVFSAADFANAARSALDGILARDRIPVLAGGTGLYFRALTDGLSPMPDADPALRTQIAAEAAARGWPALHAELARVDPEAASRIHATDPQRIQRALEVYRASGRPISAWQRAHVPQRLPVRLLALALAPEDRATLHARIEARFDTMLAGGFLDEVRALRALPGLRAHPAPLDLPALRAVGYRQAWEYLDAIAAGGDADTAFTAFRDRALAATRQLAKRQFTWLRGDPALRWFDPARDRDRLEGALARFIG